MYYAGSAKIGILFLGLMVFILAASSAAQDGRWVEYDMSTIDAALGLGARGDGLIGYAPLHTRYFLVFDVNVGEWLTIDLGEEQEFQAVVTRGHLAMVYSDELVAAYSDKIRAWDTVYYSGTIRDAEKGFGLSDDLGYFLTDEFLYVFDGETGEFARYAYTCPADYMMTMAWAKSDYVGVALFRLNGNPPMYLVYSAHTKSFNQLEEGIPPLTPYMDHGFARVYEKGEDYLMVGYSAYDNQFDVEFYDMAEDEFPVSTGYSYTNYPDVNTVTSQVFRRAESFEYSEAHHYAYDTRHGEWVHQYYYYDFDDASYSGSPLYGGNFASDLGNYKGTESRPAFFIFFNGANNEFRKVSPIGVDLDKPDISYRHGGNYYAFWDSTQVWAYVPGEDYGGFYGWVEGEYAQIYDGWDYLTITRYIYGAETMRTYFYNSRTKDWQSVQLPNHWNREGIATTQYYLHSATPENEAIFYSSPRDEILYHNLPDDDYAASQVRGHMASVAVNGQSVLFDGKNGNEILFDFNTYTDNQHGVGTGSALFCDKPGKKLYGYSSVSGLQSSITIDEEPYVCLDSGYIGIQSVWYNGGAYNKIYAYNGFANSWVTLVPTGNYNAVLVGERTALIARSAGGGSPAKLYAFDPQRQVTAVEDDNFVSGNGNLPEKFTLDQNYPNPFNPSTVLEYSLPRKEKITIEVFDILGRKVRTILNQEMTAGRYRAVWNGKNDRGAEVATGVYFCRVTAGSESLSKKMVLLK